MRAFIVAVVVVCGLAAAAHVEDRKPAGAAKGAAVGALAGHEVGN